MGSLGEVQRCPWTENQRSSRRSLGPGCRSSNLYRRSMTPAAGGYRYRVISSEQPTATAPLSTSMV
jgi:hypothetical protein